MYIILCERDQKECRSQAAIILGTNPPKGSGCSFGCRNAPLSFSKWCHNGAKISLEIEFKLYIVEISRKIFYVFILR